MIGIGAGDEDLAGSREALQDEEAEDGVESDTKLDISVSGRRLPLC